MAKLSDHQSAQFTKVFYLGDSGTGKTGSLVSLVAAGYKLRILDTDNGLDVLKNYVKRECPDKIGNVDYETIQDRITGFSSQGATISGTEKAFSTAIKLMNKWTDSSVPSEWGPETIFVLDSLTGLGNIAYEYAKGLNPGAKEPRTWYYVAQQAVEAFIEMVTGKDFHANVIIITHVNYKELVEGVMKGWPSAIGSALGPSLPTHFNTMVLAETVGFGPNAKRKIKTTPTGTIDLKNPAPFTVEQELPLGTGLATLFQKLKEA